jgi:hypothetical protein
MPRVKLRKPVLKALSEPVFQISVVGLRNLPPEPLPQVLLHLTGQAGGLVVEPVHELARPQLLPKRAEVLAAGGEGLGGIRYSGGEEIHEVGCESTLEDQAQGLRRIGGADVLQRVYATSAQDGCGGGPIRRER